MSTSYDKNRVIVVGGGLAGLSACHGVIQRGGNVLLLDKNPFLGLFHSCWQFFTNTQY